MRVNICRIWEDASRPTHLATGTRNGLTGNKVPPAPAIALRCKVRPGRAGNRKLHTRDLSLAKELASVPLTLKNFLADPYDFIQGNKMVAVGVKDEAQLDDFIAYLKEATQ